VVPCADASPPAGLPAFLAHLRAAGVSSWVENDQLRYRAPAGVVAGDRRDALVARKPVSVPHVLVGQAHAGGPWGLFGTHVYPRHGVRRRPALVNGGTPRL
jgi:hypothetical protein